MLMYNATTSYVRNGGTPEQMVIYICNLKKLLEMICFEISRKFVR